VEVKEKRKGESIARERERRGERRRIP